MASLCGMHFKIGRGSKLYIQGQKPPQSPEEQRNAVPNGKHGGGSMKLVSWAAASETVALHILHGIMKSL